MSRPAPATAAQQSTPTRDGRSGALTVSVLICCLNEEHNLSYVLPRIPPWVNEVLLVDGHSTDNTVAVAQQIRPGIRILFQPGQGKGDALRHGLRQAAGDLVVTLDADGQTDPADLPRFVEALGRGYDFAKGTRFRRPFSTSRPLHRIVGNWIITLVFDLLFLRPYTDLCSGYNAFRRDAILKLDLAWDDGFADEPMLHARVARAGLRVREVAHSDPPRRFGNSKSLAWRQGFRAIKTIIRERLRG